jgi:hypothetical protein
VAASARHDLSFFCLLFDYVSDRFEIHVCFLVDMGKKLVIAIKILGCDRVLNT